VTGGASALHAEDRIALPGQPEEITAEWLTTALRVHHPRVVATSVCIGEVLTGTATKVRLLVDYNAAGHAAGLPATYWVKAGFGGHELSAAMLCFYEAEVEFYRNVAAGLELGLPRCYFAGMDRARGEALIVLEDLLARNTIFTMPGETTTPDRVAAALDFQARFHAATWGRTGVADIAVYPGSLRPVLQQVLSDDYWARSIAKPRGRYVCEPLRDAVVMRSAIGALWDWDAANAVCLIHGDAHYGNMYIDRGGAPGFIDWQMAGVGHWSFDVAYFVVGALTPTDRRANERDLLAHYLDRLAEHGGRPPSFDEAWDGYRRHVVHGLFHTANADEMYPEDVNCAVIERYSAATRDLDALTLLLA
jgi:hypothetical protein